MIFLYISNVFIIIHEYAILIVCISENPMKVLCLNIPLVTRLTVKYESLLRYEYFCRDIPILYKRIMHCHGNHTISHSSNGFILLGNILLIFVVSQNN